MVTSIGTFAQNEVLRRRILDTQTEFNRLQVQVSSGKRGANYSSLGENARLSLSLQQSKTVTQTFIQANITTEIRMEQMQSVLERIKTLSNDVRNAALPAIGAATIPAANGNAALKAQANGALLEIAQLLNTQIDGFYLFGGRQSDAPPMVEPGSTTAGARLQASWTQGVPPKLFRLPNCSASIDGDFSLLFTCPRSGLGRWPLWRNW